MKIFFCIATIIALSSANAFPQDDSTRYIFGLPVSDDDTTRQFPDRDLGPTEKIKPVSAVALPDEVREALESNDHYKGWQDSTVYLDLNTGLYIVPVKYPGGIRIFGLNKEGEPVTYDDVSRE